MPDQHAAATEHAILQEITAPLESLPDDPLAVVHADFPVVALRGYDRDAVDDYVRRTRQLVAELHASRSPESAVRRALERVGEQISGILQRAHETAEEITAQSRIEAEDRLEQARLEAQHIIEAAEARVRELDADTDRIWLERQRIVADAEDLAGQLQAVARAAAQRFPEDEDDEDRDAPGMYADAEPGVADLAEDEPGAGASDAATMALPAVPAKAPRVGGDELGPAGMGEAGSDAEELGPAGVGEAGSGADELGPAGAAGAGPGAGEAEPEPPRPDSEDTTAVIPPASQAASRRLHDS